MPRALLVVLLAVTACGPALQPLPPMAPLPELAPDARAPAPGGERAAATTREAYPALESLRARGLVVPVRGVTAAQIHDTFDERRDGLRVHNAQDILAKRGTPVLAADDGTILHMGKNTLGGNVIWATDRSKRLAFYYAHLEGYAKGLRDGQAISRGDVIGFVGTSGNAPKDTPHLHFQLMRIVSGKRYSDGPPVNPLPFFTVQASAR